MTLNDLITHIANNRPTFKLFSEDPEHEKKTKLEIAEAEIENLKQRIDYLTMAQYYTGFVKRHLTEYEIEAFAAISRVDGDISAETFVALVGEYNNKKEAEKCLKNR